MPLAAPVTKMTLPANRMNAPYLTESMFAAIPADGRSYQRLNGELAARPLSVTLR